VRDLQRYVAGGFGLGLVRFVGLGPVGCAGFVGQGAYGGVGPVAFGWREEVAAADVPQFGRLSESGDLAGDEDGEGESADGSGQAGVAEDREQEGAEGGELEGGADGCEGDVAGQAEAAVQAAATVRATRRRRLPWSSSRHLRAGRPNHRYAHRGLILPAPQGLIYPV
jgi:hypothetical protein